MGQCSMISTLVARYVEFIFGIRNDGKTGMLSTQVCNLTWSLTSHELVSTHGFSSTNSTESNMHMEVPIVEHGRFLDRSHPTECCISL